MGLVGWCFRWITWTSCLCTVLAIPGSLIDEITANELNTKQNNKVKRAHPTLEENDKDIQYYGKPTAIKRGTTNLKGPLSEWEHEQQIFYENPDNLPNIQSSLYNIDNTFDDKTIAEYEKGYHYGTNKDKLDEALENAVLKSELYGEPAAINQYRYYGNDDKKRKRRRRRDAPKSSLTNRLKRDADLTPEEILSILTLYENQHGGGGGGGGGYRPWKFDEFPDKQQQPDDDETWLDGPVYPQTPTHTNDLGPGYMIDEKRSGGHWGNFIDADERKKRFMVAKRRGGGGGGDPTRNNFYTLTQLLSNQHGPNLPVYHRLVL